MADLLKSRIEQALSPDPWNDNPDHVRWVTKQRNRDIVAQKSDHYPTELVDTGDCRARVIDRGRNRLECDVDDLDDPELEVLLHGACRSDIESRAQFVSQLGIEALLRGDAEQRDARRHEMTDPAQKTHPHLGC